jgi:hypothetical protein
MPMTWTSSSTAWMTAASAFSAMRRGQFLQLLHYRQGHDRLRASSHRWSTVYLLMFESFRSFR